MHAGNSFSMLICYGYCCFVWPLAKVRTITISINERMMRFHNGSENPKQNINSTTRQKKAIFSRFIFFKYEFHNQRRAYEAPHPNETCCDNGEIKPNTVRIHIYPLEHYRPIGKQLSNVIMWK